MTNAREGWLTEANVRHMMAGKACVRKDGNEEAAFQALCRMALAALEQEWRPIETAPKVCDPSVMLANSKRQEVWMDWWDGDSERWNNAAEYGLPNPTHWLPLPTPPKEK